MPKSACPSRQRLIFLLDSVADSTIACFTLVTGTATAATSVLAFAVAWFICCLDYCPLVAADFFLLRSMVTHVPLLTTTETSVFQLGKCQHQCRLVVVILSRFMIFLQFVIIFLLLSLHDRNTQSLNTVLAINNVVRYWSCPSSYWSVNPRNSDPYFDWSEFFMYNKAINLLLLALL